MISSVPTATVSEHTRRETDVDDGWFFNAQVTGVSEDNVTFLDVDEHRYFNLPCSLPADRRTFRVGDKVSVDITILED